MLKPAVRVHRRVAEVGREAWDACARNPAYAGNPFVRFDFLDAAEQANCATERTGWGPQHLSVEDEDGRIAAVMPLYMKSHSQGEYIFDHAWADAYERAGGRYYPKLLSAAPFTPATGARFLARPDVDLDEARKFLLGGALTLCGKYGVSSFHVNFPTADEWRWMGEQGMALREGQQYHWENRGYATFDDFLAALSSGRRKTIRRERREAVDGLEICCITGEELGEEHWDAFFGFYMDTGSRKWGRPYLNRRFFALLHERMADKVLLVLARREGQFIAGALNLIGDGCLYGRHWGAIEHRPFLHFELCYYQAVEWAIGHGLTSVQAGAQGEHKVARGYEPVITKSAHFIPNHSFRDAVAQFLDAEREGIAAELEWVRRDLPYRSSFLE